MHDATEEMCEFLMRRRWKKVFLKAFLSFSLKKVVWRYDSNLILVFFFVLCHRERQYMIIFEMPISLPLPRSANRIVMQSIQIIQAIQTFLLLWIYHSNRSRAYLEQCVCISVGLLDAIWHLRTKSCKGKLILTCKLLIYGNWYRFQLSSHSLFL